MFAKERQDLIYEKVKTNGAVVASELVEEFGVSIETIRRDLLTMEGEHRLNRVHGGAVTVGEMKPRYSRDVRNKEYSAEKLELAKRAADFISEGDIIAIDSGSTATALAEVIKERFTHLTVITYSLDVFDVLKEQKEFDIILCGGRYVKTEGAFNGALTLEMLDKFYIQKAFIVPMAVSLEYGIAGYAQEFYSLMRKMIERSDSVFVLADSSKFEKRAFIKIDDVRPEYYYVTDSGLSEQKKQLYKENKINVYCGSKQ